MKRTEQNLIVRSGKSEAEITNNRRLHSTYCIIEATDRHEASRGLSAIAGLLVSSCLCNQVSFFVILRLGLPAGLLRKLSVHFIETWCYDWAYQSELIHFCW